MLTLGLTSGQTEIFQVNHCRGKALHPSLCNEIRGRPLKSDHNRRRVRPLKSERQVFEE